METTFEDAMDSCYQIMLNEWTKEEIIEYFKEREKHSVEVVRCGECVHRDPEDKRCDCGGHEWVKGKILPVKDDFFCADGERKEGAE